MLALIMTAVLCQTPADLCRAAKDNANEALTLALEARSRADTAKKNYDTARAGKQQFENDGHKQAENAYWAASEYLKAAESQFAQGYGQEFMAWMVLPMFRPVYFAMASESYLSAQRQAYVAIWTFDGAAQHWVTAKGWY